MSIRKRLILSNLAMILIPVLGFIITEIVLTAFILDISDIQQQPSNSNQIPESVKPYLAFRMGLLLVILTVTNGLLTYFVSKSIIKPVKHLSNAAKEISKGNLNFKIKAMKKDELGELSETFEMMRVKLKEADELQKKYEENRKELIASISHDLKTPITSIKGYVEGIKDGIANTPEKMERYIQTIYTKATDLDHLIDELFLYSKLDLSRIPFHFETIDLHSYLLDYIEELQFDLEKNNVTIRFHTNQSDSYQVMVDREKLKRVVMNIVQNSLNHMDKENKKIEISLQSTAEKVIVKISDNGIGISEADIPHIFDRFYRADESRNTKTGGSGLGLAIVKRIVEEHGGEIWAESKVGEGTSIFFSLNKPNEKVVE